MDAAAMRNAQRQPQRLVYTPAPFTNADIDAAVRRLSSPRPGRRPPTRAAALAGLTRDRKAAQTRAARDTRRRARELAQAQQAAALRKVRDDAVRRKAARERAERAARAATHMHARPVAPPTPRTRGRLTPR